MGWPAGGQEGALGRARPSCTGGRTWEQGQLGGMTGNLGWPGPAGQEREPERLRQSACPGDWGLGEGCSGCPLWPGLLLTQWWSAHQASLPSVCLAWQEDPGPVESSPRWGFGGGRWHPCFARPSNCPIGVPSIRSWASHTHLVAAQGDLGGTLGRVLAVDVQAEDFPPAAVVSEHLRNTRGLTAPS